MNFRLITIGFFVLLFACKSNEIITISSGENVLDFGADRYGKKDATLAFQNAIDEAKTKVFVPDGKYRIDNAVFVNKNLFLDSGVEIVKPIMADNTDPVFWLNQSYSTIKGDNKKVKIRSEKASPQGLIRIGHLSPDSRNKNILYCDIRNLTLEGSSVGRDNKAIVLFNAQEQGDPSMASYFHSINNLIVQFFNTGIHLQGMSNANSISGIIFNRVGSSPGDEAILIEGAMENRIYDIFHHLSPNAVSIRLIKNGKIAPVFNYIFGMVSERGGDNALCADIQAGKHNIIEINCNTLKGFKLCENFEKNKNVILKK